MTTFEAARALYAAGINCVPISLDGTKKPTVRWKHLQTTPTAPPRQWFDVTPAPGIAAVCGAGSGNLECIDFDLYAAALLAQWSGHVDDALGAEFHKRLCVVRTPRKPCGYHVWYRCAEAVTGNQHLAMLSPVEQEEEKAAAAAEGRTAHLCMIETRGQGGYALTPDGNPAAHETGRPYVYARGLRLTDLQPISAEEREVLLVCARMLCRGAVVLAPAKPAPKGADLRPGDDFDRRGWDWGELLTRHGWTLAQTLPSGERRWRRPGKMIGWSATTGVCVKDGVDLMRVWSTSADPFTPGAYGRFRAYAALQCGGDVSRAAGELRRHGFGGSKMPPPQQPRQDCAGGEQTPPADQPPPYEPEPVLIRLSSVTPEPMEWILTGWMPLGALSVLDGDPGLGKSSMSLDWAARLSTGAMPGAFLGTPQGTILIGAEDSLRNTVRPRIDAAGGDPSRIFAFEGLFTTADHDPDKIEPVTLPKDLKRLAAFIKANGIRLVVIDPLMAFLGSEFDAHKDQDIRRCLKPLSNLAESLRITILLLRHLNKLSGGPALYRGGSSIGISGAARASMIVGRDPNVEADRFVLAMNKINGAPLPTSMAYKVQGAGMACRVVWEEEVDLRPDQILNHGGAPRRSTGRPADALAEAQTFLADLLAAGPVPTSRVMQQATAAGIAARTLTNARAMLGVVARRDGGVYYLALPQDNEEETPFDE